MGIREGLVASAIGPLGYPARLLEKVNRAFLLGLILSLAIN